METRVAGIEREIIDLKRKEEILFTHVHELQEILHDIVEKQASSMNKDASVGEGKVKYLTEVNEQMFQQNKRLRQLIETCIDTNTVPTHQQFSRALQG